MSKRCVLPGATKKKSVKDVTWIPNRGVSAPAFWSNRVFSKNPTLNTLLRHTHGWENLGKTWWSLLFDTWCIGLALVSTKVCPTGSHMVPVVCNTWCRKDIHVANRHSQQPCNEKNNHTFITYQPHFIGGTRMNDFSRHFQMRRSDGVKTTAKQRDP